MMPSDIVNSLVQHPIFDIDAELLAHLTPLCETLHYQEQDIIYHENTYNQYVYFIQQGKVAISQQLADNPITVETLSAGAVIGENTLLKDTMTVTSAIALTSVTLLRINVAKLKKNKQYQELYEMIKVNTNLFIVKNYDSLLSKHAKILKRSLQETRLRINFGMMIFRMIVFISFYALSLQYVVNFIDEISTSFFSLFALTVMALSTYLVTLKLKVPLSYFGVNQYNLKESMYFVLASTVVIVAFFLGLKLVAIEYQQLERSLFEPIVGINASLQITEPQRLFVFIVYFFFCCLQELVARGALQSSFFHYYEGSEIQRHVIAIFLSNLLFATFHSHMSFSFALASFCTGLFWGYLYARYKNLYCVILSHYLIGVFATFIIDLNGIVYNYF